MMGAFSIWHWLVVLAIVVVVFGTKKLRNLGGDLGSAIKGFKEGIKDSEPEETSPTHTSRMNNRTIEGEVREDASQKEEVKSTSTTENISSPPPSTGSQTINIDTREKI